MDSKIKKLTVLAVLSVVLLSLLLVLLVNKETEEGKTAWQDNGQTSGTENVAGSDETDSGIIVTGQIGNDLSAFLRDETFFDHDNTYQSMMEDQKGRLSLVVTSIEKDLRVQVVDYEGDLVAGESFYVEVEGLGEYKDLDKDGVIYIGDLTAGEYFVELKPLEGYKVPVSGTRVRVKDHVEYLVIDDISLLIKTEADINPEEDDTQEVITDADKTEIKKMQNAGAGGSLGIDVSKWNKEIDWDKVKKAGVDFAIIRCGYRGSVTGSLVEDPYFAQNIKGATAAGIKVGVYFFTQAVNEVEAVEEASMVISLIRDYELDYPVFIDTEGAGGEGRADGLDVETRTTVCEAFCATIKNAGYKPGVYASRNWYNNRLETAGLEKYVIWLAEYRSVPLYQGYYQMWQYTSKGSVNGISGKVDLNLSYLGY